MNLRINIGRNWALKLTLLCVILFAIQSFSESFTNLFLLNSSEVLYRPWILITHVFLHGSLRHLFSNLFALVIFGMILERAVKSEKFLKIFFAAGLVAGISGSFFYTASLGASGAVMGILGCLAILRPRMIVWVMGVPMPMILAAGVWAALDMLGVFIPSNIANIAHLAGLAVGILFGIYFRKEFGEPFFKKKKHEIRIDEGSMERWERDWM